MSTDFWQKLAEDEIKKRENTEKAILFSQKNSEIAKKVVEDWTVAICHQLGQSLPKAIQLVRKINSRYDTDISESFDSIGAIKCDNDGYTIQIRTTEADSNPMSFLFTLAHEIRHAFQIYNNICITEKDANAFAEEFVNFAKGLISCGQSYGGKYNNIWTEPEIEEYQKKINKQKFYNKQKINREEFYNKACAIFIMTVLVIITILVVGRIVTTKNTAETASVASKLPTEIIIDDTMNIVPEVIRKSNIFEDNTVEDKKSNIFEDTPVQDKKSNIFEDTPVQDIPVEDIPVEYEKNNIAKVLERKENIMRETERLEDENMILIDELKARKEVVLQSSKEYNDLLKEYQSLKNKVAEDKEQASKYGDHTNMIESSSKLIRVESKLNKLENGIIALDSTMNNISTKIQDNKTKIEQINSGLKSKVNE